MPVAIQGISKIQDSFRSIRIRLGYLQLKRMCLSLNLERRAEIRMLVLVLIGNPTCILQGRSSVVHLLQSLLQVSIRSIKSIALSLSVWSQSWVDMVHIKSQQISCRILRPKQSCFIWPHHAQSMSSSRSKVHNGVYKTFRAFIFCVTCNHVSYL